LPYFILFCKVSFSTLVIFGAFMKKFTKLMIAGAILSTFTLAGCVGHSHHGGGASKPGVGKHASAGHGKH